MSASRRSGGPRRSSTRGSQKSDRSRRGKDQGDPRRSAGGRKTGQGAKAPGRSPARSGEARREARSGVGGTQVEGRQATRELLLAGKRKVREILISSDLDRADIVEEIMQLAGEARVPVTEIGRTKLDGLARTGAPQGIIAYAAEIEPVQLEELCATDGGKVPFVLALDGVTDPGNLGALLRSAESAGVTGVVLPRHRAVHVTPTVAKAAAGAVEYLPIAVVGGLPTAIEQMSKRGVWSVGLDETGPRTLWELQSLDAPVVVILGAEGKGLSRLVRQRCDQVARVPMLGRIASLNVSVAGALACFEVARARQR